MLNQDQVPECSVIIPIYNVGRYIRATVESVIRQCEVNYELILVDDGSTDESMAIAQECECSPMRVISQVNGGPSSARNQGLNAARADFVLFLDGDDLLLAGALARLLRILALNPQCVAVYGEVEKIDENGKRIGAAALPLFNERPSGDVLERLVCRNFITTPGVLCARRESLLAAGGFREDLSVAEDWEFWCRLALVGPFQYLGPDPVLAYRVRPRSAMRTHGLEPVNALRSVDAVFENMAVLGKLAGKAVRIRQRAIASTYSFSANQRLRERNWPIARGHLWQCLRHDPVAPREWLLFLLTLLRWLPTRVESRLT